jgi:hypothetical protein
MAITVGIIHDTKSDTFEIALRFPNGASGINMSPNCANYYARALRKAAREVVKLNEENRPSPSPDQPDDEIKQSYQTNKVI